MTPKIEENPDAKLTAIEDWLDAWSRGEIESPLVVQARLVEEERRVYEEIIKRGKNYWKADYTPKEEEPAE